MCMSVWYMRKDGLVIISGKLETDLGVEFSIALSSLSPPITTRVTLPKVQKPTNLCILFVRLVFRTNDREIASIYAL